MKNQKNKQTENLDKQRKADAKQIGVNLKNIRKQKNLTQEDLAGKLGLSKNAISLYEKGEKNFYISDLLQLSIILEVSIVDFLRDTNYISSNPPKDFLDRFNQLSDNNQELIKIIIDGFYRYQKTSEEKMNSTKSTAFDSSLDRNSKKFYQYQESNNKEAAANEYINQFFPRDNYSNDEDYYN